MMSFLATLRETAFDPLLGGSVLFERLLEATSCPGRVVPLGGIAPSTPSPAYRPLCALLLTVLDRDVTFHVIGRHARWLGDYLRFNTGAAATSIGRADFVVVADGSAGEGIERARRSSPGTHAASATIVYLAAGLSSPPASAEVRLLVDDLGGWRSLGLRGVAAGDFERLARLRGVDLWIVTGDGELVALPRSTAWRVRAAAGRPLDSVAPAQSTSSW